MAFAQVGARFILGLMSVVVFLTPAHADPAASAHASAIALKLLVRIMALLLRVLGWEPSSSTGAHRPICKAEAAHSHNIELSSGPTPVLGPGVSTDSRRS